MYFVSYTTTRENTKTRLNAENIPKSNAIHNLKLHQKQKTVVNYNYIVQDLHFRNIAKFSKGCKEMRTLQNIRQPTIKGNEWQRTNAERQILVKKQQRHQNEQIRKRPNHSLLKLPQTHRLHLFTAYTRHNLIQ